MAEGTLTETLYICREVQVYKIPPRLGGGHRSGTWQVADKIFNGRLRLTATGPDCLITLEDSSGAEFATCPIPLGERSLAVEPVTDSSRYFVLRLLDKGNSQRRAFVGLGFTDRSEAFDFNVALSDHEKHVQRSKEAAIAASQAASNSGGREQVSGEAAVLYKSQDLSLKEGETITINVKRPSRTGGFLSSNRRGNETIPPPRPSNTLSIPQPPQGDILGFDLQLPPAPTQQKPPQQAQESNWATF